jgi:hypothetical protein
MSEKAYYAVLAGKLADNKQVSDNHLSKIPDLIRNAFQTVNGILDPADKFVFEIIRLDEFLAKSEKTVNSLASVLLLMSAYRSLSDKELGMKTELKVSLGLGPIEFLQNQLRESDGTAFRLAIKNLTRMKRSQRILVATTDQNINDEFTVTCGFMDILIREWSDEQAEALFLKLTGKNQVEISEYLEISQPAVNRRLKAAHFDATERFINRSSRIIEKL